MLDISKFLKNIEEDEAKNYKGLKNIISFEDFLKHTIEHPEIVLRSSYQYVYQAIMHFGTEVVENCGEKIIKYKLFDDPFYGGTKRIFGCERPISQLLNEIRSSAMEEGPERIIVMHGPVGTAKTGLLDLLEEGLKAYSREEEGSLFRFKWKFDLKTFFNKNEKTIKGFGRSLEEKCTGSCDSCEDCSCGSGSSGSCSSDHNASGCGGCSSGSQNNIITVPCQINETPLHLIKDRNKRKKYLESIVEEFSEKTKDHFLIPHKLLEGNLCYNCRQIYDALLEKYDGELEKVLSHVEVERFTLDSDRGLVICDSPSPMDNYQKVRVYANDIAAIFPQIDFITMYGRFANGNRGMIHHSDIFHHQNSIDALNDASEKHRVIMNGAKVDIDSVLISTTNTKEYYDVGQGKYSERLIDRISKADFPYIFDVIAEAKIYERDHKRFLIGNKHIAPHTYEVAALWAILTRLSKSIQRESSKLKPEQQGLFNKITPLQKVEIYMEKSNYEFDYIGDEDKALIDAQFRKELRNATEIFSQNGTPYFKEGNYGISPRRIQDLFKAILKDHECLNPLEVIKYIDQVLNEKKGSFKFLEIEEDMRSQLKGIGQALDFEGYHDSEKALEYVTDYYHKKIVREVKYSILDLDENALEKNIISYIDNIELQIQKDAGLYRGKVDKKPIEYFENLLFSEPEIKVDNIREKIIRSIRNYHQKNPDVGDKVIYRKAIPWFYTILELAFFAQKSDILNLDKIQEGLELYNTEAYKEYNADAKVHINNILSTMKNRYKYCDTCSRAIPLYVLKNELLGEGMLEELEDSELEDITADYGGFKI